MKEILKRKTVVVVIFTLLICITLGCVSAYFIDNNKAVNTFTTGNVKIKVSEPKYESPENVKSRESLAPGELVIKDPVVTNTGESDCFVFAVVDIPRSNRAFIDSNGKKMPVEFRNLFEFEENNGWTFCTGNINNNAGKPFESYVFAYANGTDMAVLRPGEKTSSLFKNDTLKFANVIELPRQITYEIPVKVYALQTTDLLETEGGQVSITAAYKVLKMQNYFEGK